MRVLLSIVTEKSQIYNTLLSSTFNRLVTKRYQYFMGRYVTCATCQQEFLSNHRSKIYCSQACKQKSYRDRKAQEELLNIPKRKKVNHSGSTKSFVFENYALAITKSWARRFLEIVTDERIYRLGEALRFCDDGEVLKQQLISNCTNWKYLNIILEFLSKLIEFSNQVLNAYNEKEAEHGYVEINFKKWSWEELCWEIIDL